MNILGDILTRVFDNLRTAQNTPRQKIIQAWPSIAGSRIAGHTKPDLKDRGMLIVWVDQSALAFELRQRYEAALLKRVQAVVGSENVSAVRFKVGQLR